MYGDGHIESVYVSIDGYVVCIQVTQEICDRSRTFKLLGSDRSAYCRIEIWFHNIIKMYIKSSLLASYD